MAKRGRPKNDTSTGIEITPGETLTGKDRFLFTADVLKARVDPMWFLTQKLKWTPFPMQETVIRTFYQDKYDPSLPEYKKLIGRIGQRCISGTSLIKTKEYGDISIKDLYIISNNTNKKIIHVYNSLGYVLATEVIYAGDKESYNIVLENGFSILCSKDHKFLCNDVWIPLNELKVYDEVKIFDKYEFKTEKIKSIEFTGKSEPMYDLHVPEGNCYVANGMLTHNSGKTVTGAKIGVYEFFELATCAFPPITPAEYFGVMRNQKIGISCVASSKDQASDNIFSLIQTDIEESEWFNNWFNLRVTDDRIDIDDKNIFIKVAAANAGSGAAVGGTSKAVFGDEVDLWHRTTSKAGAEVVWSKMVNSTQTLGIDGKCIAISSTQYADGMITKLYLEGLNEKTTLCYDLPTWKFNPNLTEEGLREEYKYKMEYFYRDFANQPEVSGGLQFPEKVKLNKNIKNVLQMEFINIPEYTRTKSHIIAIDPAYTNDSFGIGCGYMENGNIVVDGATKFQKDANSGEKYIKPSDIRNFLIDAIKSLNVHTVIYDVFNLAPELIDFLQFELNVNTIQHIVTKDDYDRWRELQEGHYTTKLDVVYDDYLEKECNQLIVTSTTTGKPKVDHTKYSSKDVADTVANVIWYYQGYTQNYDYTPLGTVIIV